MLISKLLDSLTVSSLILNGGVAVIGFLLISLVLYIVESLYTCWTLRAFTPAGSGPKWIAWLRTSFQSVFGAREIVDDAYQKVIPNICSTPFLSDFADHRKLLVFQKWPTFYPPKSLDDARHHGTASPG